VGRQWGGAPCAVSGEPVTPDQTEYEIQFARDAANPGLEKYSLHIRCFSAWEMERTKPEK
jgi:hypothetical protein